MYAILAELDLNNKHLAYLALSDRYNGLDKNIFEAQQNK